VVSCDYAHPLCVVRGKKKKNKQTIKKTMKKSKKKNKIPMANLILSHANHTF
jgi:hypothetical protein